VLWRKIGSSRGLKELRDHPGTWGKSLIRSTIRPRCGNLRPDHYERRISTSFVDFATFPCAFDAIRCVSKALFLV
jgi:hypothetical protein